MAAPRRGPGGPGRALLLLLAVLVLLLGGPTGADGDRPGPRGAGGRAPRRAAAATRADPGPQPAAAAVLPVVIWHRFASSYRGSDEGQAQWLQDLLEKAGVGYVVNVRIGKGGWKEDAYR